MCSHSWKDAASALAPLAIVLMLAARACAAELQPGLVGDTRIHDPSVIDIGRSGAMRGYFARLSRT